MSWIKLVQDMDQWRTVLKTVMKKMEYICISRAIIDKYNNIFMSIICVPSDDNVRTVETMLSLTYKFQVHAFSQNAPFSIPYVHNNKLLNVATMRYLVQETLELHFLSYSEEHTVNTGMRNYIVLPGG